MLPSDERSEAESSQRSAAKSDPNTSWLATHCSGWESHGVSRRNARGLASTFVGTVIPGWNVVIRTCRVFKCQSAVWC